MVGPQEQAVRWDNWFVLLDPAWQPASPDQQPPPEKIVGGWMLDEAGNAGPFEPNPNFVPQDESTPTDPVDALLRLVQRGEDVGDQLLATIKDAVVEIAVDDEDEALVGPGADGKMVVLVVTAPVQRAEIGVEQWRRIHGVRLPEVVPEDVDILLNPDGSAPFRLSTDALRES